MQQNDFYQKAAKHHGYRARSAWKLRQLDDKYNFIAAAKNILELGSAPGGWTQVIKERAPQSQILACDLLGMQPLPGVCFWQGDFRELITPVLIKERLGLSSFSLVLSDLAPDISGNQVRDQAQMLKLCLAVIKLAQQLLDSRRGLLLLKAFQGSEFVVLADVLQGQGFSIKRVKPAASKQASKEVYILAKKAKINLN